LESDERPLNGFKGFSADPVGLNHLVKLAMINPSEVEPNRDRSDLKDNFPQWRAIGPAVVALVLISWGWFNLRLEGRLFWGFWSFIIGCSLWVYSLDGLSTWINGR
jgi:hypothetical protein